MIKANIFPLLHGMASVAFGTEVTTVHILDPVAIDTTMRQALVALANVACRAGDFAMSPLEGKSGLGVIECLRLSPVVLSMA